MALWKNKNIRIGDEVLKLLLLNNPDESSWLTGPAITATPPPSLCCIPDNGWDVEGNFLQKWVGGLG